MSKKGHLSSEEQQKRLREREALERRRYETDLKAVMGTPTGRRFVWRVIQGFCGSFGKSFNGNTETTIYREGRRAVGVELMEEIQRLAPHLWVEMEQERLRAASDDELHVADAEAVGRAETDDS